MLQGRGILSKKRTHWICLGSAQVHSYSFSFLFFFGALDPDKVVMAGSKKIICPGTLAEMYKSLGKEENIHMYGKPYSSIYRLALELMKI